MILLQQKMDNAILISPASRNRLPGMTTAIMNSMLRPVLIVSPRSGRSLACFAQSEEIPDVLALVPSPIPLQG